MFCPQIKFRAEHLCAIRQAHRSLPAQMAMRIKFSPQIINHIRFRGFFSCSGRISICAPNIRCANKLAHYKQENLVSSASPNFKLIAYSFCWRERKRKYVLHWQMACSKLKWILIATVPDLCPTTVKILTHLISRYHLPLRLEFTSRLNNTLRVETLAENPPKYGKTYVDLKRLKLTQICQVRTY